MKNNKLIQKFVIVLLISLSAFVIFSFVKYHAIYLPFGWQKGEFNESCQNDTEFSNCKEYEPRDFPFLEILVGRKCEDTYSYVECTTMDYPVTETSINPIASFLNVYIIPITLGVGVITAATVTTIKYRKRK